MSSEITRDDLEQRVERANAFWARRRKSYADADCELCEKIGGEFLTRVDFPWVAPKSEPTEAMLAAPKVWENYLNLLREYVKWSDVLWMCAQCFGKTAAERRVKKPFYPDGVDDDRV